MKKNFFLFIYIVILSGFFCLQAQPGSPVLPKHGHHLWTDSTLFSWNTVDLATVYHLQIAKDSLFDTLVCDVDVWIEDTVIHGFTHPNTYYWRVKSDKTPYCYPHELNYYLPTDFSKLVAWYAADSVHLVGNNIDTLYDKSGNRYHIIQPTANRRPTLIFSDSTINNQPSIYFDGGNFLYSYNSTIHFQQPNSFLFVGKILKRGFLFDGGSASYRHFIQLSSLNTINFYDGTTQIININDVTIYNSYYSYFNKAVNSLFCKNKDTLLNKKTGGTRYFSLFVLGTSYDKNVNNTIQGNIPEFIYFNKTIPLIEQNYLNNYLSCKYITPFSLGKDIYYGFAPILSKELLGYSSFVWSTGDTIPQINLSPGNLYWVEAIDRFGKKCVDTIQIGYKIPIEPTYTICQYDTLKISMDNYPYFSDYSYQWSNGQTTSDFFTTEAGTYNLVITDTFGYQRAVEFEVFIDSFPSQVKMVTDSLCTGNTVKLLFPQESLHLYQIIWNGTDTMSQFPFLQTSQVSVEVTNPLGCIGRDTQLIVSKGEAPVVSFSAANVCFNQMAEFTNTSYTIDGTFISDLLWNFGDNNSAYSFNPNEKQQHLYDSANIYSVSLWCKTNSGCENTYSQTIAVYSLPKASFSPTQVCVGTDVMFSDKTDSEYPIRSYLWKLSENDIFSITKDATYHFDTVGEFSVTLVAESIMGCKDSISQDIIVKPNPTPFIEHTSLCFGQNIDFLDKTNVPVELSIISRKWFMDNDLISNKKSISQDIGLGKHKMQLQVQYANGCTNTQTTEFTIYPLPIADFTTHPSCQGNAIKIENNSIVSNANVNYIWNINGEIFKGKNPTIILSDSGTYPIQLVLIDDKNCADTLTKNVEINPKPKADFDYDYNPSSLYMIDFKSKSNTSNGNYQWTFNNKDDVFEEYASYDFKYEGIYPVQLIIENSNGCKDTIVKKIQIDQANIALEIVNFSLQEINNMVRPIVWVLNKGNRNIPYLDYTFIYDNDWTQERENQSLQAGTMASYNFSSLSRKHINETFACIEVASPYDIYKTKDEAEKYCIGLTDNFKLLDLYPNPCTDLVYVQFILPQEAKVDMKVVDILGNVVYKQEQKNYEKGYHLLNLNFEQFASGVYILQMKVEDKTISKKIIKL